MVAPWPGYSHCGLHARTVVRYQHDRWATSPLAHAHTPRPRHRPGHAESGGKQQPPTREANHHHHDAHDAGDGLPQRARRAEGSSCARRGPWCTLRRPPPHERPDAQVPAT
jgi:hypothetical protein